MDASERKSVWIMNHKMKADIEGKNAIDNLILSSVYPSVKEIVVDNMW